VLRSIGKQSGESAESVLEKKMRRKRRRRIKRKRERESLFAKYITWIIHINCYNGRLPVEALAHRSWPPIQKT